MQNIGLFEILASNRFFSTGIFAIRLLLSNDSSQIRSLLAPVAVATKGEPKLAITRLV